MASSKELKKLTKQKKSAWDIFSADQKKKVFSYGENYKNFLKKAKTARLSIKEGVDILKKNGFVSLTEKKSLSAGDKVYLEYRGRNLIAAIVGEDLTKGANFVISHIDSPHLDFKPSPLYEEESLAFLKSHYYGGIKKYHWPALPLALYGVVFLKGGRQIEISVGEREDEPAFMITDLLPHLAKKQMGKPLKEAIAGEELNVLVGSIPVEDKKAKERVKLNILKILHDKYGIKEEDFFSAELEVVPLGNPQDIGWDRGLLAGYGQDDKVCAYAGLRALLSQKGGEKSKICFWVDKEEIGSEGVTGAQSLFLENFVLDFLEKGGEEPSARNVYRFFANSSALSGDVTAGYDPDYKYAFDHLNTARLGWGVAVEKHTGSGGKFYTSEAQGEYVVKIREMLDKSGIPWQSAGLGKIDEGGGGTIAMFLARRGMDIIDLGVPLFNMHAPWEISSKADVYALFLAYQSFYKLS